MERVDGQPLPDEAVGVVAVEVDAVDPLDDGLRAFLVVPLDDEQPVVAPST